MHHYFKGACQYFNMLYPAASNGDLFFKILNERHQGAQTSAGAGGNVPPWSSIVTPLRRRDLGIQGNLGIQGDFTKGFDFKHTKTPYQKQHKVSK